MVPNRASRRFLEDKQGLPPGQVVALIGSHRRVAWPPLCPACGAAASTSINVAKIFGRYSQHSGRGYYRLIVRMRIPFCGSCAERHQELIEPVPSVVGSFFRTPAVLSFFGAAAVVAILSMIFLQGGEGVSMGVRLYVLGGLAFLLALGIFITAREARFLRVPPLTEVTRACDFGDNVGFPFGRRRFLRHPQPRFRRRVHRGESGPDMDRRNQEAGCPDLGDRVRVVACRGADCLVDPRLTQRVRLAGAIRTIGVRERMRSNPAAESSHSPHTRVLGLVRHG